ncbi:efflux RND transporter permease subunit [Shewanella sp. 4t3-1-2LB]|uniref:efflux RND transporter permease subunit n=1 Tax=Shewanella sp. 4t3-1-2LB TaxID=2817682 RepID=UPI001A99AEA4|nr:efflux RND transporter permease subunit [Shewanella sp. 4t3-1-2LB]MBO1272307.1 efflux RND transporter permease subunit [Shewanella sp. 4t3-1-2LB]
MFGQSLRHSLLCWLYHTLGQTICTVSSLEAEQVQIIGIFCIYCVLVLLFHDFMQPFTILSALPLSLGGAIIGIFVTHTDFTMPVIIGILMLMGVVTKNSILLVEYAIAEKRNNGISRFNALVNACEKRARPIIMTTLAMTFGMLPNALGWGNDTSFSQPMAIVVIAGLLMSTLLSLVVVSVIYTLVDDMKSTILKMLGKVSMHKIYA